MTTDSGHRHHTIDYLEFTVNDLDAALTFYEKAFGWEFTPYGDTYAGIRNPAGADAPEVGGITVGTPTRGGPLVLLYSDDLEASLAAVQGAGARVVNGPYDFPGGRRFHFTDPSGNELGVWSPS